MKRHAFSLAAAMLLATSASFAEEAPLRTAVDGTFAPHAMPKLGGGYEGFNIDLAGSPVGTWLQKYRDGKMAFGLSLWGDDYPDPADYLVFTPGQLVGLRAGWPKGVPRKTTPPTP